VAGRRRQRDKDAAVSGSSDERGSAIPYDPLFPPDREHDQDWLFAEAEKRLTAANETIGTTRTFFFALYSTSPPT
jgi:hypothetical protein